MKEDQSVEWKQSWRDEHLKSLCGFANADGGRLVVGRDDNGGVVGIANARKLLMDVPNKVRDILGIMVDVNLLTVDGKDTLEIVVEPYPYPVSYKGEYHYRTGSTKQELKGAALDRFLLRKQGRHWDGAPVPYVTVADLDENSLESFRGQARNSRRLSDELLQEPDRLLLEKLHLLEGQYLKRAAVLLFHPEPERFITGAYVKIGYFESDADLLYQDEIHGELFTQVNKTIEVLLTKYLKSWISYKGLQRIETLPVPESALREAILNAVVHKDYASAVPVQISVYPNRLMIWNPGQLPSNWTVERLLTKHASQPFNPDVANAFFRAGMVEASGRGIEGVLDACRRAGIPAPEFRDDATGLWIVFTCARQTEAGEVKQGAALVARKFRLLEVLESEMNRPALQRALGLKDRKHFQVHYLEPTLTSGLVEMTLPGAPRSRRQKYRLTDKGRAELRAWLARDRKS